MDVRYRVPAGLHHLPRRVRHSIRYYVWVSFVCKVLSLANERPDGIGEWLSGCGTPPKITDPLLDGPSTVPRPGHSVSRSDGRTVHYTGYGRRSIPRCRNEHNLHRRGRRDGSICE